MLGKKYPEPRDYYGRAGEREKDEGGKGKPCFNDLRLFLLFSKRYLLLQITLNLLK